MNPFLTSALLLGAVSLLTVGTVICVMVFTGLKPLPRVPLWIQGGFGAVCFWLALTILVAMGEWGG